MHSIHPDFSSSSAGIICRHSARLLLLVIVAAISAGGIRLREASAIRPAGTITGTVFHDYNANGAQDTTTTISNNGAGTIGVAIDTGVAGVTITAYDASGAVAGTATSSADGSYSLPVVGVGPYRVEFTSIPSDFQPGPTAPGAKGSSSTVQFVTTQNATNINLSLVCATQFCQDNPALFTTCFVFGEALNGPNANEPAVVGFPYASVGNSPAPLYHVATARQVGSTFGVAWQRASGSLFLSAFMKRHSGFGPGGTGAIYRVTNVKGASPDVSLFFDLNGLLGAGTTGTNPHPTGTDFLRDPNSFDAVGKISLGGLKLSEDEQTLYTINLATRELYRIPIGAPPTAPANAAGIVKIPVPTTVQCSSPNDVRPFGLGVGNGKVYVGAVCSAQTSQNVNDLRAAVYAFDPATNSFNPVPVLQFPLNYPRGFADAFRGNPGAWRPWATNFTGAYGASSCPSPEAPGVCYPAFPQPILSDIVFDRGAMVVALRDRYGDQIGSFAFSPDPNDPKQYGGIVAGDILRAAPNAAGGWTLENNAASGGVTTGGASNNQGPGNGEFYYEENLTGIHDELGMGSLLQIAGFPDLVAAIYDPTGVFNEGGVRWFSNDTGRQNKAYRIYSTEPSSFGKANGLGGMVALCNSAPLEIGNRVWRDRNGNGVQDADESGIAGVTVTLCDANDNQIASTVTNGSGNYYFNDSNVPGGLRPATSYRIKIDKTQSVLSGLPLSSALAGANRAIDSNGVMEGNSAVAAVMTGAAGASDHTLDFGFGAETDLTISITDNRTTYVPGGKQTYIVVVTNNGPGEVTNASINVTLPPAIMSATWTCAITAQGNGSVTNACGVASGSGNINTTVTLRHGAAATFTLMVMTNSSATGLLTVPAVVTAPPGIIETNLNNNTSSDTDTPNPEVDLAITKTDGQFNYTPGDGLIYRITVVNNGPSDVTNAVVTDNLPAALTGATWTCAITAQGSGSVANSCGAASGNGSISTTVSLRSGGAALFTLRARVSDQAVGGITNTVTVTAPPGVTETNTSNNTASDTDARIDPPVGGGSDDEGCGGSVLIYPLYASSAANPGNENTRLNLTNTNSDRTACVHLFFVDGSTCSVSDSSVCLTPNQTITLLASDVDPGVTGYLIAVAVDCITGCPVNFNHLLGDAYVKFASGQQTNLKAQLVPALQPTANFVCDSATTTATLRFDNTMYGALPRALALDNIASPADGNSTMIVLDRIGGNLDTSLSAIGPMFGILYNDLENPYSFGFTANSCQFRQTLSNTFPRSTPRLNQVIPAGASGWMKLWSAGDAALLGVAINLNRDAATNSSAFNHGHTLHTLTQTTAATLSLPVFPPNC
jgi:uncharacterized repeat protein (TIGR01451 family)